jgi:thiazole biosynthesis protein ThiH
MPFSSEFSRALSDPSPLLRRFEHLLAPVDDAGLSRMARESATLTRRYFGRTMRLFAPLYLSNECINSCSYCGFSKENAILRVTLEIDEVEKEANHLASQGFRNILLVAGEHPKFVSGGYMAACLRRLTPLIPSVSLEVAPMETADYIPLVEAGAEGLVVYQETYHPETYATMHLSGPKKDYTWRLDCPERAYQAGFRRVGIGALFGLWHWQEEALALAAHLEHLLRTCWKAQLTVSLPRLRPAAGEFQPTHPLPDREFKSGLAEVVKYGMILDPAFFDWLAANTAAILSRDAAALRHVVGRSAALKADVVERDEREITGLRAILNYGHTFAHAYETAAGYGTLLHGEAVAIGMVSAAALGESLGRIGPDVVARQEQLLRAFDLPVTVPTGPGFTSDALLATMARDKKTVGGRLRFVLPTRIGHVELVDGIDPAAVRAILHS